MCFVAQAFASINVGVERFVRCRERKTSSERRELRRSRRFLTIGELWFAF